MKARAMHWRLTAGFIGIFAVATCCLYFYMSHTLERQTIRVIQEDMRKLQMFAYDHIAQYALFHEIEEDRLYEHIERIMHGVSRSSGHQTAYYDSEGRFRKAVSVTRGGFVAPETQEPTALRRTLSHHLDMTRNGSSVVTVGREGDRRLVLLSFPFYVNEHYAGTFRMTSDYSERFAHNAAVLRSFAAFGLLLFVAVTLFAFYMSRRITRPLAVLSRALLRFGEGKPLHTALPVHARDEAGELSRSFERMKRQIEEQMERIAAERNRVMELEQSRRRFYQHVTHELKTPLTTISGYAQIVGSPDFDDPAFLRKAAGAIKAESDRLHGMVVQVIELARMDRQAPETERETVNLMAELESCCEDMVMKANKYYMTLNCRLEPAAVNGRKDELRQVWMNVLDNAIKYGAAGTVIDIALTSREGRAIVRCSNEVEADADTVDGELVFEAFYRGGSTPKDGKGSVGLGLAISRSIIERHEGAISFIRDGRRATVEVELPLCS